MMELNGGFEHTARGTADVFGSMQESVSVNSNSWNSSGKYSDPTGNVNANDWNASRLQAQIQAKSETDYQQNYRPVAAELNASALYDKDQGGQDIEKVARAGAHLGNQEWTLYNQGERAKRQQGRLNAHTDALTEREGDYERRTTALSTGLGEIHASKLNQYSRNSAVRDQ